MFYVVDLEIKLKHLRIAERAEKVSFSPIRNMLRKAEELKDSGYKIYNLSAGRPDFNTPDHIIEKTKKALDNGLVHYTSSEGTVSVRKAVCSYLEKKYKIHRLPEEVIITNGAIEANYIALQTILDPTDEVLLVEPVYPMYSGISNLAGANCINVPLREEEGFLLNPQNLEKYITNKTKAFILVSPNNPTGQYYDKNILGELAALAIKHNFYIVSDDIYCDILYDGLEFYSISNFKNMIERTIIIGSLSKTYAMDGWRVGYLVAPKEIISSATKIHQHIVSCPNTFVQIGAEEALTSSQESVIEMVEEYNRRRSLIMDFLDEYDIPYVKPRGAFYFFPNISKFGLSSQQFCDFLLEEAKVATVPGIAFGSTGEGYIRISYTLPLQDLKKALTEIGKALKKLS
jgi:aminotransferase